MEVKYIFIPYLAYKTLPKIFILEKNISFIFTAINNRHIIYEILLKKVTTQVISSMA